MKILINTATSHKGGAVQVALSFIYECIKFSEHEYHVILGLRLNEEINKNAFPQNFYFYAIPYRPATKIFTFKSAASFFNNIERKVQPDVVFSTTGPSYWRPKAKHLIGFNLAHYIYKESPFYDIISPLERIKWRLKGQFIKYYYKRDGDAIVGQTTDVTERAGKWIGKEKLYTVSNTCSNIYRIIGGKDVDSYKGLPPNEGNEFRLLLLSGYHRHKNIEIINDIASLMAEKNIEDVRFILTLKSHDFNKYISLKAKTYTYNVGPIPTEEGPVLYNNSDALFLPTLLESFSASYPEAMVMRKPIVTTNLSFAKNICQDAALYYDPLSGKDALAKICILKNNKDIYRSLIKNGEERLNAFDTPEERAKTYLLICKELVDCKA
ncbi:MAG: glycosyltransferase [Candidatus Cyclobacteriaceae bacterium M2_1C_046]